jgi:hypothetical protein
MNCAEWVTAYCKKEGESYLRNRGPKSAAAAILAKAAKEPNPANLLAAAHALGHGPYSSGG